MSFILFLIVGGMGIANLLLTLNEVNYIYRGWKVIKNSKAAYMKCAFLEKIRNMQGNITTVSCTHPDIDDHLVDSPNCELCGKAILALDGYKRDDYLKILLGKQYIASRIITSFLSIISVIYVVIKIIK